MNESKVRLQYAHQRQEVTGLIVNKKVSVSESVVSELKNAVYYCGNYGVESHMQHIGCDKAFYKEHLYGLAYFVKMVEPAKGRSYLNKLDSIIW